MEIPLAIKSGDYNSVKGTQKLVNMLVETDKSRDFVSVRRAEGLELSVTTPNGEPMRSNIHKNGDYKYFVAGDELYRWDSSTPTDLGEVGGSGRAQVLSNSVPGNNQILILNGGGDGYIYDNSGLNQITDVDFYDTTSATILNERFWFSRDGTNEFFASDTSDGTSYNPLSFGTAEWKPDDVVIVVSKGSALWVIGTQTMEYWQSVDDSILPVRSVRGASKDIGILAKTSFAELDEFFAFLADDSNVVLVSGTEVTQISDLDFQIKIRGDGTSQNPGFTAAEIDDCIGFFVDTPQHKIYVLNFPSAGFTWAYDLSTGLPFTRESLDGTGWRGIYSLTDENKVYVGDRLDGSVWLYSPDAKGEGSDLLPAVMQTPSVSFKKDVFINSIAIEMEVAVAEDSSDPLMIVSNTKDGGKTWITHSHISLGKQGVYQKRVIVRNFGRLVRNKDFALKLRVTDAVRVQFYSIEAEIEEDAL